MAFDPSLIGSVVNALPIDKMVAAPLLAAIQAQVAAAKAFTDFLVTVCIKDGKAVAVQFDYEETQVDTEGNVTGVQTRTIRAPLLSIVPLPNFGIETVNIQFELTVTQSEQDTSSTAAEAGADAQLGWGPYSVKVHGSVSHKSEQTRKTDTSAKYSFQVTGGRQDTPEALMKIIDFLTAAQTRPAALAEPQKGAKLTPNFELPAPSKDAKSPGGGKEKG